MSTRTDTSATEASAAGGPGEPNSGTPVPSSHPPSSSAAVGLASDRERLRGHVALVFVQIFFGLFPFFAKWALVAFDARVIVGWRVVLGSLVFVSLALARYGGFGRRWREVLPTAQELPRVVACSLLGVVINQALFVEGMARTTAVDAGVLMPSIPVFAFLFAILLRQEAFRPVRALGIAIALVGVMLLAGRDLSDVELAGEHRTGNLLILTNCASYAMYLIVARPLLARRPALLVMAWVYTLALWSVPFLVAGREVLPSPPDGGSLGLAAWGLAYIIVFPTIVSYLLNTFALARVRASTTAVYIYLQPLVACASGVLWLGESLPPEAVAAAACLFVGIWLVARVPERRPPPVGAGGERSSGP